MIMSTFNKQQGMTLIEVLVGAVILFSVLVVMANLVSVATKSSQRAEQRVAEVTFVPLLIPQIRDALSQKGATDSMEGELMIQSRKFRWHAVFIEQKPMHPLVLEVSVAAEEIPQIRTYNVSISSVQNPGLNWSYIEWLM